MSRVLVLGAGGMLGHKAGQALSARGHEVFGTLRRADPRVSALAPGMKVRAGIDALEGAAVEALLREIRPDFVLNAIGLVKQLPEAADRELMVSVNAWLPHRLARACRDAGARLIHMSTDCVFSGRRGRYAEGDDPDPEDLYGRAKLLGEPEPSDPSVITIRSSLIGRELSARTRGLVEWLLASRGRRVKGFARAVFSGFTSLELSRIVALIVEKHPELHGLFHVASEPIDKFTLLGLVRDALRLDVEILRDDEVRCDRSLVMDAFPRRTGYRPPSWPEMVREMCSDPTPYDDLRKQGSR